MIGSKKLHKMVYGGDYNPEQWDEAIWNEDMRLFKLAGVDVVTLNVFSWAKLQPSEEVYDFEQLDRIMAKVRDNGLYVCLATSTGAHPAWMAKKYPDILRTDFNGIKRKFGGRHNSCPNSLTYKKYAPKLARKLAEHYGHYDNLVAWHISNEFGGECYCPNCEKAFQAWLKEKYKTLENLNRAWNSTFWGHTFYNWDEIVLPNQLSEHFAENSTMFQGISLDYRRFNSDSLLECYKAEYEVVKAIAPHIPVTTNLMGFYKSLDYQKWAKYMDFIAWDSYPSPEDSIASMAMGHDLMRSLKGGQPFVLMEQTPSVTNWKSYNALKRPGVMRLWSYQAVAHGADAVMFFQMRRSIGACEKFHGAVIDHVGHEHTRVFKEVSYLGEELKRIGGETLGAREHAQVAIVVDWDNWWALEYSAGPSCELQYKDELLNYYTALHEQNVAVDFISVEDGLESYKVVIAPLLYMTKPHYEEKLEGFVERGGTFITTYFSGIVDEHDLVVTGGYPGKLRNLLGIWVEEIDALPHGKENQFTYKGSTYPARLLCDIIHLEGAKALSFYETDFYAHTPVLTRNKQGNGYAYYVGTRGNQAFYECFIQDICKEQQIAPVLQTPKGVEVVKRIKGEDIYLFILNHTEETKTFVLEEGGYDLIGERAYIKGKKVSLLSKEVLLLKQ